MVQKYTDEQLSMILGEHAAKHLIRAGSCNFGDKINFNNSHLGCVNQVAFNQDKVDIAYDKNPIKALWFDCNYEMTMTPEELLKNLEEV